MQEMTVEEMIDILTRYPKDMTVRVSNGSGLSVPKIKRENVRFRADETDGLDMVVIR